MLAAFDFVPLVFYGLICMFLAGFVPARTRRSARLAIGAAVGICAAAALPELRVLLGL